MLTLTRIRSFLLCQTLVTGGLLGAPAPQEPAGEPVRVRHVSLDLTVSMEDRALVGTATLEFEAVKAKSTLVLDTWELTLASVTGGDGAARPHELEGDVPGPRRLLIQLQPGDQRVAVRYRTGKGAPGLRWVPASQAPGGRHGFVYSLGRHDLTRSWLPIPDRPGARLTFRAKITAPPGTLVRMSAAGGAAGAKGTFVFAMERPVAPHRIALVCGELETGPPSGPGRVSSHPGQLATATGELDRISGLRKRFTTRFGAPPWARDEIVVMPRDFPFLAVGCPHLTMVSPGVLVGDGSGLDPVVRGQVEAWTAAILAPGSWRDEWIGRGLATYLAQRLSAGLAGTAVADRALVELGAARQDASDLAAEQRVLHRGREKSSPSWDPLRDRWLDQKGAAFFRHLEDVVGMPALDTWLRRLLADRVFRELSTETFLDHLRDHLLRRNPEWEKRAALATWIEQPALPPLGVVGATLSRLDDQRKAFLDDPAALKEIKTGLWNSTQWRYFLDGMPGEDPGDFLRPLDQRCGLATFPSLEVRVRFFVQAFRLGRFEFCVAAEELGQATGALELLAPMIRALSRREEGKDHARELILGWEPILHPRAMEALTRIVDR